MASINGLTQISATSIQNAGQFYLGNSLDSGTPGQVIISAGPQQAAEWGSNSATLPGALTMGTNLSLASGNASFDGATPDTINATSLTITGGNGISVVAGTQILTDNDNTTINNSGGTGQQNQVLKVPNALTSGTNVSFSAGTTFDGSAAITISSTDTDTTYAGGTNISIDTSTNPDEINLDTSITGQTGITFLNNGTSTNLTGSNYPNLPTTATYLDLSSSTNIISGGVLATKVQETALFKSFGNTYGEYSTNFRTSFVAKSTNVMVEFRGVVRADNKIFYGGLYDYNAGSYQADTRNRFNYNDESDQDMTTMTWWMKNLSAGTTYYISPYFRGSSSTVYIYAGHTGATDGFAPAIMRIYDGGNNVDIY